MVEGGSPGVPGGQSSPAAEGRSLKATPDTPGGQNPMTGSDAPERR